ncbi:peptide ABC transporter substrate-binding protein [Lichenicoccus sp.]|uniref:peptide ABC transporter substrate-binding protein n=1 Tax=Lichenicoccus sp. TaxID=2781899 RepID=UPI003D12E887
MSIPNPRRIGALLTCALLCAAAAPVQTCGTVVLPIGLGQGAPSAVTSLNPLLTNSIYNQEVIYQIYRPLIWLDRHLDYDPALSLASAAVTPDGGHTWRFTIKPWQWSDGVPVTPADVVFTFELMRRLGPSYVLSGIGGVPDFIQSVRATGPHDVTMTLNHPVNPDWFLRLGLGNSVKVLPEHVYRSLSLREMRMRQTDPTLFKVSDGPFVLADYAVGRHIVLVPNPRYGGIQPRIRRLVLDFLEGGNALQALRSGEIDAASIPFELWDLATALPNLRTIKLDGPFGYLSMIMNFRSRNAPFLRDLRVRQAIALALDQNEIISLAYHGQAKPVHGSVPPAITRFLSPEARAGYPSMQFSPARARALLDAAGWHPGPDGTRVKDGQRLQFEVEVSSGAIDRFIVLQAAQRNLAAVGIGIDIRGVEFSELIATLQGNGHDWNSIVIAWTVEAFPDSQEFFSSDGAQNFGHFEDKKMDALNAAVATTAGSQALDEAQDYAAEQQPFIFLPTGAISLLARPELHGLRDMASPTGTWSPELLSLSGDMACPAQTASAGTSAR